MHRADYVVARSLSVRPSVRPSVTRRYCVETSENIIELLRRRLATPCSFSTPNVMAILLRGPPNGDVKCMGVTKSRFSTNISLYLGNDTKQGHS